MRPLAVLAALAAALSVNSCSYREQVIISGSPERPTVTIKPARRGPFSTRTIGVDYLTISNLTELRAQQRTIADASSTFEDSSARWRRSLVWNIARSPSCDGPTRIEYGTPPPGFRELPEPGPARPLIEGHIYAVTVGGCGLSGGGVFKISKSTLFFAESEDDLR